MDKYSLGEVLYSLEWLLPSRLPTGQDVAVPWRCRILSHIWIGADWPPAEDIHHECYEWWLATIISFALRRLGSVNFLWHGKNYEKYLDHIPTCVRIIPGSRLLWWEKRIQLRLSPFWGSPPYQPPRRCHTVRQKILEWRAAKSLRGRFSRRSKTCSEIDTLTLRELCESLIKQRISELGEFQGLAVSITARKNAPVLPWNPKKNCSLENNFELHKRQR